MEVSFFNTLSRRNEVFRPIEAQQVKMYTCGPTVYNFAHIGGLAAGFVLAVLLYRKRDEEFRSGVFR